MLRSALTPFVLHENEEKFCQFSCGIRGEAAEVLRPPQLRSRHSTASFVTGFVHPSKAHVHIAIVFAPREGPHSPHSSLVSTLLEEGEDEAGEEAGGKKKERERRF